MSRTIYLPQRPEPEPARFARAAYLWQRDACRSGSRLPCARQQVQLQLEFRQSNAEHELITGSRKRADAPPE